jgi:hypothetical protein
MSRVLQSVIDDSAAKARQFTLIEFRSPDFLKHSQTPEFVSL